MLEKIFASFEVVNSNAKPLLFVVVVFITCVLALLTYFLFFVVFVFDINTYYYT